MALASRVAPRCSPNKSFKRCSAVRLPSQPSPVTCNSVAESEAVASRAAATPSHPAENQRALFFLFTRSVVLPVGAPFDAGIVAVELIVLAGERPALVQFVF